MNSPLISIIVPTYNEENCIYVNIGKINDYFSSFGHSYEIIVSDDGSTDNTINIIKEYNLPNLKIIRNLNNVGKGHAIKRGVLISKGKHIFFTDADLSTPIEEFRKLFAQNSYNIVIWSRKLNSSEVESKSKKIILGNIGAFIISSLAVKGLRDTQCGFKLYEKEIAKDIFEKLETFGFAHDIELVIILNAQGIKIKELPVNWTHISGSKLNIFLDTFKMLIDILKIYKNFKNKRQKYLIVINYTFFLSHCYH